jgi:hypothetical protein
MSLASYSDLETAVANWLGRAGDTVVTTNVPDWITLCEARIAYGSGDPDDPDISMFTKPLRIRAMETPVDLVIGTPIVGATVGGTANAITLTPTASIASYTNGLLYQFSPIATNTAAATLNVSGVGVTSIVKDCARDALSGNELVIGGTYNVYYDALNAVWVLLPDIAQCPLPASYLAMRSLFYYWGRTAAQIHDRAGCDALRAQSGRDVLRAMHLLQEVLPFVGGQQLADDERAQRLPLRRAPRGQRFPR